MTGPARGADRLVGALQRAGVRTLFTLSGNHVMPVYDALVGSGIRLVHTRHEAAAVHMADGLARITGGVGVALVTGGPGHANAVSALYTALMAESPVVLLSGHAPLGQLGRGAFQEMRQAEMAAPVAKASWTCERADALADDLARAVQIARSGRPGPVHLSLPSDLLEAAAGAAGLPAEAAFAPLEQPLPADTADSLRRWLLAARRPLVLAGPQACTPAGSVAARSLETALGVPVIGMESPRGVADPALGRLAELLAAADAVLLLAKRLDFTLKFGQAPSFAPGTRFTQIDADVDELDRSRRALGNRLDHATQADFGAAIDALLHASAGPAPQREWLAQSHEALRWRPPEWRSAYSAQPGLLHPVQALAPLQAALDSHPDALLVSDGGEFGQWAQAVLCAPRRLINGVAGAIGAALPLALGARCALPAQAPVVAVSGDGSAGFHIAEVDTGVRCALGVVLLVGNDARWNAEHQIQLKDYGADRTIGCELLPTRYDQVVQGFGGRGETVTQAAELPGALQRALASAVPACLNVMIEGLPAPKLG